MTDSRDRKSGRVPRMLRRWLAAALAWIDPAADPAELSTRALLVMQLGEATMRLAISVGREEGDALVEAYKRMALRELAPEI